MYTLDLPEHSNIFPTFHSLLLHPFIPNDDTLFLSHARDQPGPMVLDDSSEEFVVERILNRCRCGEGFQYLVCWQEYGPQHNMWLLGRRVADLQALDNVG